MAMCAFQKLRSDDRLQKQFQGEGLY